MVASGGTVLGSEIDFASTYLRFVLGYVGITDVTIVDATAGRDVDASLAEIAA